MKRWRSRHRLLGLCSCSLTTDASLPAAILLLPRAPRGFPGHLAIGAIEAILRHVEPPHKWNQEQEERKHATSQPTCEISSFLHKSEIAAADTVVFIICLLNPIASTRTYVRHFAPTTIASRRATCGVFLSTCWPAPDACCVAYTSRPLHGCCCCACCAAQRCIARVKTGGTRASKVSAPGR